MYSYLFAVYTNNRATRTHIASFNLFLIHPPRPPTDHLWLLCISAAVFVRIYWHNVVVVAGVIVASTAVCAAIVGPPLSGTGTPAPTFRLSCFIVVAFL